MIESRSEREQNGGFSAAIEVDQNFGLLLVTA
jgi:hypothetical protein